MAFEKQTEQREKEENPVWIMETGTFVLKQRKPDYLRALLWEKGQMPLKY